MNGLLLDTQILVWIAVDDRRLPLRVRERILDPDTRLFVSAVTACEFVDFDQRGRLPPGISLPEILDRLGAVLLDFPAQAWELLASLPPIHRDPVDRMVLAHALASRLTVVTADSAMRSYPVECLW